MTEAAGTGQWAASIARRLRLEQTAGVRIVARPTIDAAAWQWTPAGARSEAIPPLDLRALLEEALKYIEASVEGRLVRTTDALGPSLSRALDIYSMDEHREPAIENALLANLDRGRT